MSTTIQFRLPKTLTQGQVEEYLGMHWYDYLEEVYSDKSDFNKPMAKIIDADSAGANKVLLGLEIRNLAGVSQANASIAYKLNSNTGDYDIDLLDLLDMEISSLGNYQIFSYTFSEDVGTLTKTFIYDEPGEGEASREAFNTIFETDDLINIIRENSSAEKFLNKTGLTYLWNKIKNYIDSAVRYIS